MILLFEMLCFFQNLELIRIYIHVKANEETQHAFSFLFHLARLARTSINIYSNLNTS